MAWIAGYTTRKKLTTDNTKVDATLTNFPVLVKLTSANFDFAKANADGFDIRFTESDGTTLCKYERERHDNTNSLAEYWVKVPSISSSAGTDFYIYYRTTDTADGADPTAVWDANFKGVWHKKDITTSTINDSTVNANNGTKKAANEPIEANGKVAKGQNYDGTNDYINVGTGLDCNGVLTISALIKTDTVAAGMRSVLANCIADGGAADYVFEINRTARRLSGLRSAAVVSVVGNTNLVIDTWYHAAMVISGSAGAWVVKVYLNGVEDGSGNDANNPSGVNEVTKIGQMGAYNSGYFDGIIDETRLSFVIRTTAWLKAEYNSAFDTLLTYGGEETAPAVTGAAFLLNFV